MLVEHPRRLAARVNDRAELVGEAGRGERELTVVLVDVELSALRARLSRRVGLEDGRGDAMHVENAGEGETPRPAPTMVTGVAIRAPFTNRLERCSIHLLEQCSSRV